MRVGGYGGATRQSFGAMGDDVNTAARLMALARPGEILMSGRVKQAVGHEFTLEARPPIPMKGKAEPLPVFAVLGLQQARAIRLQGITVGSRDDFVAMAQAQLNPISWTFTAKKLAGNQYELHMTATPPAGWHIYSQNTPEGGPIPTSFTFNNNALVTLSGKVKETGKTVKYLIKTLK